MNLQRLEVKGATVIRGAQVVPFADLPDGLIAVSGANGSGKTTLLDCIFAALYREMPTRPGNLADAFADNGYIELEFLLAGTAWKTRVDVLPARRKHAAHVWRQGPAGYEPATGQGRLASFDAWADHTLPAREVLLASVFSPQNRQGNFLDMPVAQRRRLFRELLQLDAMEQIREQAATRAKAGRGEAALVAVRLGDLPAIEEEAKALTAGLPRRIDVCAQRRKALAEIEAELESAQSKLTAAQSGQVLAAQAFAEASTAIDERKRHLTQALTVRDEAVAGLDRARRELGLVAALLAESEDRAGRLPDLRKAAVQLLAEAREREADLATEQAAERTRSENRERRAAMAAKVEQAREAVNASQRIARPLGSIPCDYQAEPWRGCPLIAVSRAAADELSVLGADLERLNAELAGYAPPPDPAMATATIRSGLDDTYRRRVRNEVELDQAQRAAGRVPAAKQAQAETAAQVEALAARLPDLKQMVKDAKAALRDAQDLDEKARTVAVAEAEMTTAERELHVAQRRRTEAAEHLTEATTAKDRIEWSIAAVATRLAELRPLAAQADALQAEAAGWELLALAFGPTGIPALEIAAAGPDVSQLTNHLLAECYGPRFSVTVETQRVKRAASRKAVEDGTGLAEDFDLVVVDNAAGRRASPDDLSGGERVIISEAVSLALAVFNMRRSGVPLETLIRDEACGALDADNADRYVKLLRTAQRIGQFRQVVFVSHQKAIWTQADAIIHVADGQFSCSPGAGR